MTIILAVAIVGSLGFVAAWALTLAALIFGGAK